MSIAFILLIIFFLYLLIYKKVSKYKVVKILKVFINKKSILLITVSILISNTYILYLNSKYNDFYKTVPQTLKVNAVIVRRCNRKRLHKYVCN